ncbi:hypothetical protein XH83_06390 [Bradyrhizobium sp. CCBAU 53351]|nr:hypothetical protein XH83_06390 [Bradyrhizobium sp. CCBAU 53351]
MNLLPDALASAALDTERAARMSIATPNLLSPELPNASSASLSQRMQVKCQQRLRGFIPDASVLPAAA